MDIHEWKYKLKSDFVVTQKIMTLKFEFSQNYYVEQMSLLLFIIKHLPSST